MTRWSRRRDTPRDPVAVDSLRTDAIANLFDAHVDEVYRFVHRRCRDHALAEDVTQEVFMRAVRGTTDPNTLTIGWLMTVARNHLVDVLRRRTAHDQKLRLVAASGRGHDEVDHDERLRIEAAMARLRVDHRLVLTLHYIDGYTVPALADHLGRSIKSVEGLVTRARRALRAELDETHQPATDRSAMGGTHD